jgi:hypothetical protein
VLRLHVSRLFPILPSPRIRIPKESQDELEAILKRHLSEWPQSQKDAASWGPSPIS